MAAVFQKSSNVKKVKMIRKTNYCSIFYLTIILFVPNKSRRDLFSITPHANVGQLNQPHIQRLGETRSQKFKEVCG